MGDRLGIPGAVGFLPPAPFSPLAARGLGRRLSPRPGTAAGPTSSGPSHHSAPEGALPAGLAGQEASRRPWKADAPQPLLGWLARNQTPPQAGVPAVRPARPSTCTWPRPPEPSRAAASWLPVCLSAAPSGKSPLGLRGLVRLGEQTQTL